MRYMMILLLLLLGGCGLMGKKDESDKSAPVSTVSMHDRDMAECEMKALETIPSGPDSEARIDRYTRLCMQSRGYPMGQDTKVNVRIRE